MVDCMNANVSVLRSEAKRNAIVARTLEWWEGRRRALAWRAAPGETPDPYRVWLSEVLLQQTTTQAATPYFQGFILKWPRIEDLAAAPGEAVISAFAGLGYYSRARNLHACAKEIAGRGGRFPSEEAELGSLPGGVPIPQQRSRRSRLDARASQSTAISPAFWLGSSLSKSRPLKPRASSHRRRGRSRRAIAQGISPKR